MPLNHRVQQKLHAMHTDLPTFVYYAAVLVSTQQPLDHSAPHLALLSLPRSMAHPPLVGLGDLDAHHSTYGDATHSDANAPLLTSLAIQSLVGRGDLDALGALLPLLLCHLGTAGARNTCMDHVEK